ncbi:MAG: hypothetical protein EBT44_05610 [Actinobacteria bacterium]|uniref:Uncharacterized protein n=1 Tax=Candidatus Fonsibacter lacus TaxID=2576439 RepID=A0A965LLQ4_9PROT|nr:hypothetical protein [Candidatus Fonsibacter lacus]
MFIAGIFTGLGMNFSLISALMVRQVYQEDSRHLGFVGVLLAIGGLLGAGYVARLSVSGHKPRFSTMMLSGLSLGVFWILASLAKEIGIRTTVGIGGSVVLLLSLLLLSNGKKVKL